MDEKKKYAKTVHEFEGYGADPVPEQGQFLDWSDRLFLTVFPQDQRKYQFWPNNPHSFRFLFHSFYLQNIFSAFLFVIWCEFSYSFLRCFQNNVILIKIFSLYRFNTSTFLLSVCHRKV